MMCLHNNRTVTKTFRTDILVSHSRFHSSFLTCKTSKPFPDSWTHLELQILKPLTFFVVSTLRHSNQFPGSYHVLTGRQTMEMRVFLAPKRVTDSWTFLFHFMSTVTGCQSGDSRRQDFDTPFPWYRLKFAPWELLTSALAFQSQPGSWRYHFSLPKRLALPTLWVVLS